jgi:hypothetical protein
MPALGRRPMKFTGRGHVVTTVVFPPGALIAA